MASDVVQGAGSYQGNASAGAAFTLDDDWNVTVLECNKARRVLVCASLDLPSGRGRRAVPHSTCHCICSSCGNANYAASDVRPATYPHRNWSSADGPMSHVVPDAMCVAFEDTTAYANQTPGLETFRVTLSRRTAAATSRWTTCRTAAAARGFSPCGRSRGRCTARASSTCSATTSPRRRATSCPTRSPPAQLPAS